MPAIINRISIIWNVVVVGTVILSLVQSKIVHENKSRYDNYRIYRVSIHNEEQLKIFQDLEQNSDSYQYYGHADHVHQNVTILAAAHTIGQITDLLKSYKVQHEILTYDFQEKINEEAKHVQPSYTPGDEYSWDYYFHLETIYEWLKYVSNKYDNVRLINLGDSHEGKPIYGVQLGDSINKTSVFVESGIHAREWIAPATATFLINELLTSTDTEIQYLAKSFNWFIVPVVNPDGYQYSFTHDRMWRKNRNLFGICRGVDLNRNFPDNWNTVGASSEPCRYDYAGPSAGSEAETKRIIEFLNKNTVQNSIRTYFALHSYSQLIMFPYGHTADHIDNYDDLTALGVAASKAIEGKSGKIYKSGSIYETIYASSGGSKDWAHSELKMPVTFTFELRGMANSSELFILPADEIIPTASEIVEALKTILLGAEKLGYYYKAK